MADLSGERPAISVDTNVLSIVVGRSALGVAYRELLREFSAVITFFVRAEIRVIEWRPEAWERLALILGDDRVLDRPNDDVIGEYVLLKRTAIALGLRYGAEREDLWMLAQTRSVGLPVMTHDRNAARVAHAAGMQVATALPNIEEDYARDRQRLQRLRSP